MSNVTKERSTREACRFTTIYSRNGPFHTVGIDYMGPFDTSKRRNRYLLAAIDHLTKWVETRPVPAPTAANAAKFFVEQIVFRHGAPKQLLSNQGTHFTGSSMENVIELLGTEHSTMTSHNPQANGLTERMNKLSPLLCPIVCP